MTHRRNIAPIVFVTMVSAIAAVVCVVALAQEKEQEKEKDKNPVQPSAIFDWNATTPTPTSFGSDRAFFKGPTATLDQLDVHVVTLNPGQAPHPPHQHANEEVLIVKEGTLEFLMNGEWKPAGPGSAIFIASNQLHGVRNHGSVPVTFHVISWTSRH